MLIHYICVVLDYFIDGIRPRIFMLLALAFREVFGLYLNLLPSLCMNVLFDGLSYTAVTGGSQLIVRCFYSVC